MRAGLLSDLGILVSEEMTAGFARAVDVIVPKLRQVRRALSCPFVRPSLVMPPAHASTLASCLLPAPARLACGGGLCWRRGIGK